MNDMRIRDWKIKKIENLKKRAYASLCLNVVAAFILGLLPSIFGLEWVIIDIPIIVLFCFLTYRSAKALWAYPQMLFVYKEAEMKESGEWEKYQTTVDYQMDKMYEKTHTKKS